MPAGGFLTAGVVAAIIGATGTGMSAVGSNRAAKKKILAAKEASRQAMIAGITDAIKAREAAKLEREANEAKQRSTMMWIIFLLVLLFVVLIVVAVLKRKKEQQQIN